jgi:hypothetical protein
MYTKYTVYNSYHYMHIYIIYPLLLCTAPSHSEALIDPKIYAPIVTMLAGKGGGMVKYGSTPECST